MHAKKRTWLGRCEWQGSRHGASRTIGGQRTRSLFCFVLFCRWSVFVYIFCAWLCTANLFCAVRSGVCVCFFFGRGVGQENQMVQDESMILTSAGMIRNAHFDYMKCSKNHGPVVTKKHPYVRALAWACVRICASVCLFVCLFVASFQARSKKMRQKDSAWSPPTPTPS